MDTKLNNDGRLTVGGSAREWNERLLEINGAYMTFPAHVWTPWYRMLGSESGLD